MQRAMRSERANFIINLLIALVLVLNFVLHIDPSLTASLCEVLQERDAIRTGEQYRNGGDDLQP